MLQKIAFYPSIALILLGMAQTGAHAQPPRNRPPNFRPGPPRGPVVINHYENNGSGLAASALGFGAGLLVGSAASSPPPPSTVIVTQPTPIITHQIPSTVVQVHTPPSDAIGSALKMLNSHWASTRRDGAILLGRQKATQAIGPLMTGFATIKMPACGKQLPGRLPRLAIQRLWNILKKRRNSINRQRFERLQNRRINDWSKKSPS